MGADLVSRNLHKSLSINELWRRGGRKVISPSFLKTYNNNQTKENPLSLVRLRGNGLLIAAMHSSDFHRIVLFFSTKGYGTFPPLEV